MHQKTLVYLLIILAIAAFFRLWKIDSIPPGLWPDETAYANDAIATMENGDFRVFYPQNHGREGLFIWILASVFSMFGVSLLSFKIVSAAIGIFTVLGIYLLTKEMFSDLGSVKPNPSALALLSAFFLAISFWHVNFSRIGFRAILLPLVLVFAFYFFFRAVRTRKFFDFIGTGFFLGLGFYTYISFRLAAPLIIFAFIFWLFEALKENWGKKYLIFAFLSLLTLFIVALPLGIYFIENPGDFVSRAMGVSVFEKQEPLKEFIKSLGRHLVMFNFAGDRNWRHNLAGFPQLSPLAGIFFLIGIAFAVKRVFSGKSKERGIYLFLCLWILALLTPGALTVEGIPHALRTIGVIPSAYILAGLGAWLVYDWLKKKRGLKWLAFSILGAMAISSFTMYFIVWAKNSELEQAFTVRFLDVGKELNALPETIKKYVVANEGDLPLGVPQFVQKTAGRSETVYLNPKEIAIIDFAAGDFVFLMNKEAYYLDSIKERFPEGILHEKERILIYEIK